MRGGCGHASTVVIAHTCTCGSVSLSASAQNAESVAARVVRRRAVP